ncbi:MAG: hypothetical protein AAFZ18_09375, partial [Myxococcota bacterium]
MSSLELDFVVYRGDPDDGVEAVPSRALLGGSDMSGIDWPGAYGTSSSRAVEDNDQVVVLGQALNHEEHP